MNKIVVKKLLMSEKASRLKEAAKLGFTKAFGPGDGSGMGKGHHEVTMLRNLVDQVMGGS